VIFIAFTALVLPGQAAKSEQYNGPAGAVDTSFMYSPDDLFETAEAYGEEGREAYVRARWTFDVVWPLVYTVFLATTVSFLLDKGFSHQGDWHLLNLAPLFAMLFDFIENAAASGVMLSFPERPLWLAWIASVATPVKWVLVGDSFTLVLIGLVAWGVRSWRNRKSE
jgi:hypothetical protein